MAGSGKISEHYSVILMKNFARSWKSSKKPRKQRKYVVYLPLHLRKKLMSAHLSKELRQKHGRRNIPVRVGDKVRVMRGEFRKKEGAIERVDRKNRKLYIAGVERSKKDGTKARFPIHPSKVLVVELNAAKNRKISIKSEVKK